MVFGAPLDPPQGSRAFPPRKLGQAATGRFGISVTSPGQSCNFSGTGASRGFTCCNPDYHLSFSVIAPLLLLSILLLLPQPVSRQRLFHCMLRLSPLRPHSLSQPPTRFFMRSTYFSFAFFFPTHQGFFPAPSNLFPCTAFLTYMPPGACPPGFSFFRPSNPASP